MKLGIVVYSNDPETVFNAFRLGVFSLGKGDSVRVFLLGFSLANTVFVPITSSINNIILFILNPLFSLSILRLIIVQYDYLLR